MPTLLLADDSVTIQRVIELTFAEEGMRVITVGDGEAAIARMEQDRPDIVLADVGMPRMDGYQVAAHMKRTPALARVPVLLLAGAFEPIDEDRARQTGCDGVLVKPFEPRQVLSQVRALLSGARPVDLWPADMPRVAGARQPPAGPRLVPPQRSLQAGPPRQAPSFDDVAEPGPMPSAPPVEAEFELGLDDLDLAFSRLDPVAAPSRLDADTAQDFQRDIHELRSTAPEPPVESFPRERVAGAPPHRVDVVPERRVSPVPDIAGDMTWDLPAQPVARRPEPDPVDFRDAYASPVHDAYASPVYEMPPIPEPVPVTLVPSAPSAPSVPPPVAAPPPAAPPIAAPVDIPPPPAPATVIVPAAAPEAFAPPAPVPAFVPPPAAPAPAVVPPPPEPPPPAPPPPAPEVAAPPVPAPIVVPPPPAPPPAPIAAPPAPPPAPIVAPPAPPQSLAAAFSALLAAEQVHPQLRPAAPGSGALSDAAVEEVVKRVVTRMTDEIVRKVVLETAERLIREEIERIKT